MLGWFGEDCSTFQSCGLPMEYQEVAYNTVSINRKYWFTENLKCSKYSNLDSIQSNLLRKSGRRRSWSHRDLRDSLYGCLDSLGSIENPHASTLRICQNLGGFTMPTLLTIGADSVRVVGTSLRMTIGKMWRFSRYDRV